MLRASARLSQSGIPNIVIELNDQEFDTAEGDIIQTFINALESKRFSLGLALNTDVFMESVSGNIIRMPLKEFLDKYPATEEQPRNNKQLILSFHVVENQPEMSSADRISEYNDSQQMVSQQTEPQSQRQPIPIEEQSDRAKSGLANFMREK